MGIDKAARDGPTTLEAMVLAPDQKHSVPTLEGRYDDYVDGERGFLVAVGIWHGSPLSRGQFFVLLNLFHEIVE